MDGRAPEFLWYVAYGSNMCAERLHHYLAGGRPRYSTLTHPGCRDPRPPRASRPVRLSGGVYFADESATWTGGIAFYDPDLAGFAATRAYLITRGQFCDLLSQETGRAPGRDFDLGPVMANGRQALGAGRYEAVMRVGEFDGLPAVTFTAPWTSTDVEWTRPAAGYLRTIGAGLAESHAWAVSDVADYLCGLPGARGAWAPDEVVALLVGDNARTEPVPRAEPD